MQQLLTATSSDTALQQTTDFSSTISTAHLVVTDDSEYGRYSRLYVPMDSAEFFQIGPLFREALGSADLVGVVEDPVLQNALHSPSLFLDLTVVLPCQVVAAWLGANSTLDYSVRSLALTTHNNDTAVLYLIDNGGIVIECSTALTTSAIQDLVHDFSPNGGSFAFESNYAPLRPYTVLVSETTSAPDILSTLPDGYTSYNLLTALDFNAHTNSRYWETGNVEVVEESPRTLRIAPDGTVTYTGDADVSSSLYHIPSAGGTVHAVDALLAADQLAKALVTGTDASPLHLYSMESTDDSWHITYRYQSQGLPVLLSDDSNALSVTITDSAITAFTYRCRALTVTDQRSILLPSSMAIAIASLHPNADLSMGYVDSNADTLTARWLAG